MEFYYVGLAGLKLLTSGDPPTSASQNAGITGVSHRARPVIGTFLWGSPAENSRVGQESLAWELLYLPSFKFVLAWDHPSFCPLSPPAHLPLGSEAALSKREILLFITDERVFFFEMKFCCCYPDWSAME